MNRKQLAEIIKAIRKKKIEEVIGLPPPFKPEHGKAKHGEDPNSPNQYAHRMSEEVLNELGANRSRKSSIFKKTVGNLRKRNKWLHDGQQSMKRGARYTGYTEEEVQKLGDTETGEKTKSRQDDVDINPNIPIARGGETSKNNNTTVKETKEK